MNPRVINIVCSHYPPHKGGVERFAFLQTSEFARRGLSVNVITHDTESLGFIEESGLVTIFRLSCASLIAGNRLPFPKSLAQLWHVYRRCFQRKNATTILHTRYYPLIIIAAIYSTLQFRRPILVDHSSSFMDFGPGFLKPICRLYEVILTLMLWLFRPRVFGVSHSCNQWLKRLGLRPEGVYYNCINPDDFKPQDIEIRETFSINSSHIVIAIGRLVKEKGVLELAKAFLEFQVSHPDWALVVIGKGELEPQLKKLAKSGNNIHLLGAQPSDVVAAFLSNSDILVNPSNYPEGLPTVLLEAGLAKCAVIATPNGGSKEVVIDRKTGLLISKGEAPLILERLLELADDPKLRLRLGQCLYDHIIANFVVEAVTDRFMADVLAYG